MVTRLPDPRLIVSSMSGGNTTSEDYAQSSPGSAAIQPQAQAFELLDLADVAIPAGKDAVIPNQPGRSGSGRFTAAEPAEGGGWHIVEGLSR
jgi:hypothetical protein